MPQVVNAHRERPLAMAAFMHGVAVHELTHLDVLMGRAPRKNSFRGGKISGRRRRTCSRRSPCWRRIHSANGILPGDVYARKRGRCRPSSPRSVRAWVLSAGELSAFNEP
jgi:hypothetical protein